MENRPLKKDNIIPVMEGRKYTFTVEKLRRKKFQKPGATKNPGLVEAASVDYFYHTNGETQESQIKLDYVERNYLIEGLPNFGLDKVEDLANNRGIVDADEKARDLRNEIEQIQVQMDKEDEHPKEKSIDELQTEVEKLDTQAKQVKQVALSKFIKAQWSKFYKEDETGLEGFLSHSQNYSYLLITPVLQSLGDIDPKFAIIQPLKRTINSYRKENDFYTEMYAEDYRIKSGDNMIGTFKAPTKMLFKRVQKNIGTKQAPKLVWGSELVKIETTNKEMARIFSGERLKKEDFKKYLTPKLAYLAIKDNLEETIQKNLIDYAEIGDDRLPLLEPAKAVLDSVQTAVGNQIDPIPAKDIETFSKFFNTLLRSITKSGEEGTLEELASLVKEMQKYSTVVANTNAYLKAQLTFALKLSQAEQEKVSVFVSPYKNVITPLIKDVSNLADTETKAFSYVDLVLLLHALSKLTKATDLGAIDKIGSMAHSLHEKYPDKELTKAVVELNTKLYEDTLEAVNNLRDKITRNQKLVSHFYTAIDLIQKRKETFRNSPEKIAMLSTFLYLINETISKNDDSTFRLYLNDGIFKSDPDLHHALNDLRVAIVLDQNEYRYHNALATFTQAYDARSIGFPSLEIDMAMIRDAAIGLKAQIELISPLNNPKKRNFDPPIQILEEAEKFIANPSTTNLKNFNAVIGNAPSTSIKQAMIDLRNKVLFLKANRELLAVINSNDHDPILKNTATIVLKEIQSNVKASKYDNLPLATEILNETKNVVTNPKADLDNYSALIKKAHPIPTWKKVVGGMLCVAGAILLVGGVGVSPVAAVGTVLLAVGSIGMLGVSPLGLGELGTYLSTKMLFFKPASQNAMEDTKKRREDLNKDAEKANKAREISNPPNPPKK